MEEIINKAKQSKYVIITAQQVDALLKNCKLLAEHDTMVADKLRLFLCDQDYLVQEKSDKGEFLLRVFETEIEARNFIMDRMKIYEDMWDGCGCKVYYYE